MSFGRLGSTCPTHDLISKTNFHPAAVAVAVVAEHERLRIHVEVVQRRRRVEEIVSASRGGEEGEPLSRGRPAALPPPHGAVDLPDAGRLEARPHEEAVDVGGQDEVGPFVVAVGIVVTLVTEVRKIRWKI